MLATIEPIVWSMTVNLTTLDDLVARRLETSERIAALRRGVFHASDETQRLLAPWLMIMDGQASRSVESVRTADANERSQAATQLAPVP